MTSRDRLAHARTAARLLLRRLGMEWTTTAPVDVEAVARGMGVRVVEAPLTGALAQLIVHGASARILLSPHVSDPGRRRAAIAHELGHYVLRHPSATAAEIAGEAGQDRRAADPDARDHEAEADCFAGELLAPPATVDALRHAFSPEPRGCTDLAGATSRTPIHLEAPRIAERNDRACAIAIADSTASRR